MEFISIPQSNSMDKYDYHMTLAGVNLTIHLRSEKAAAYFGGFLKACDTDEGVVRVPEEDISEYAEKWQTDNTAYVEYSLSVFYTCDALLKSRCCIFHGAVFLWKGKAFLFTAASGVGKTTQLKNWQVMCGNELVVLNGDKPVLRDEGGRITVHPSPWKGKERLGDDELTACLAGIIILEQADRDSIRRMAPAEAIESILRRVLSTFGTREIVLDACRFCDSLLRTVPVWHLANRGRIESAFMTRETLLREVFTDEI